MQASDFWRYVCIVMCLMLGHIYVCDVVHSLDTSTIRVDCVTVSTLPVKSSVDDHLQRLHDALLGALRHSIQADFNGITNFLTSAKESLSVKPQSVEEIGEVNQKHAELLAKKPEVCVGLACIVHMNVCT